MNLGQDLALVQITVKYLPMPNNSQWAQEYLSRVRVRYILSSTLHIA